MAVETMINRLFSGFGQLMTVALVGCAVTCSAQAESMRHYSDQFGNDLQVPVRAERIVALHDISLTLPLLELGANVVGSLGRQDGSSKPYLRGVTDLLGVDFDNSDIAFVGTWNQADAEAIAALEPDLILALKGCKSDSHDHLNKIAPVVVLPCLPDDVMAKFRAVADAAGYLAEYEEELADYQALVTQAKGWIPDAEQYTYSYIQAINGEFQGYSSYGALTLALDDIGFKPGEAMQALRDQDVGRQIISAELIPTFNADFLFDTYRTDREDSPALVRQRFEDVLPSWCEQLSSCREGRFITLPREQAIPISFMTLKTMVHMVVTHTAGRAELLSK